MKKNDTSVRWLCMTVLTAAVALPAAATDHEAEPNHPVDRPQALSIVANGSAGGAAVEAVIGQLSGPAQLDVDFYVFSGQAGDVVTLDIDGGMGGARNVDTVLGVFGPGPTYPLLRYNDDGGRPLDPGSTHAYDSRIENFVLPVSGQYIVGVSSYPRALRSGGVTSSTTLGTNANGDYTLLLSGVSVPVQQISIDIKPGNGDALAPINPKSRGKIPVALLGSPDFRTADVDVATLRFGHTGHETSLSKCGGHEDVNDDGRLDLVCHFENALAAFEPTDDEAILKGRLHNGRAFEGRGWLKMVPAKGLYE